MKLIFINATTRVATGYTVINPLEDKRLVDALCEYMNQIVGALKLKDCLVHADIIANHRECTAIEISLFPAMDHISDELIKASTGINIYREFFSSVEGEAHSFSAIQTKKMTLRYFGMENCFVHGIPDPDKLLLPHGVKIRKWECNLKVLDYMEQVKDRDTLTKRGYYILEGPDNTALEHAVYMINKAFDLK